MVSWVYTCFQTQHVLYIKYVQLFVCQSYLNKVVKKKEKSKQHTFIWSEVMLRLIVNGGKLWFLFWAMGEDVS